MRVWCKANSVLRIESLSVFSPQGSILSDIHLSVSEGNVLGIIGKSGAGKSTLLRCMNGLVKPDRGCVLFENEDVSMLKGDSLRFFRRKVGFVFQNFHLLGSKTVFENVALPLNIAGLPLTRVNEILEWVGLLSRSQSYPSELSGGQCQRVAIARALVTRAKLILCDEFTSALDPETASDILRLLKGLHRSLNLTLILVTHNMDIIKDIAHDVCVLDRGQIVEKGNIEQIFITPRHPVTQSLLMDTSRDKIPLFLQETLNPYEGDEIVLKLTFGSHNATKPLIAQIARQWNIPVNIIGGGMEHIGKGTFGRLMISLKRNPVVNQDVITFLKSHQVCVEEMGSIQWPIS